MSAPILILTVIPLCNNPRVLKEATALGKAGYDVTVATIAAHVEGEDADKSLMRNAPFRRVAVDYISWAPIALLRSLTDRGRSWLSRKAVAMLGWQSPHALGPAGALADLATHTPAELTIAHLELPAWIGCQLLKSGRRVAADFEDWYSEDLLPEARRARPITLLCELERELLCKAAYVSTTSQSLADALYERYGGRRPVVLTNSFPLQSVRRRESLGTASSMIWFSQNIGPGRGLEAFLAVWKLLQRGSRLTLLGKISDEYRARLLTFVRADQHANIQFLSCVPPTELPYLLGQHDIGLALEQSEPASRDLTITNKILQYLNAGLAVIATPTTGQREVLASAPGAGFVAKTDQPAVVARQIDALIADLPRLHSMQAAARRAAEQQYCWEREEPKLLEAVAAALKAPASRR